VRCILGLNGQPDEKRTLGKLRRRWEDNIKMNLQAVGWENGLDDVAQDRDSKQVSK